MIQLVLLDLGKVLIDFDFSVAIKRLQYSCKVNPLKIFALFRDSKLAEEWDKGLMSPEEFFETVKMELNLPLSMEEFIPVWNEIFIEKKEMIDYARHLNRERKVAVLSNTNPWHADYVRKKYEWIGTFTQFIASCDVHLLKPDPKIFELALEKAGSKAGETIYVDDLEENVAAARQLGMDGLVFKGYPDFVEQMKSRGIENREPRIKV